MTEMDVQKSYDLGHQTGLDALDALAESGANHRDGLAGLMSVVMHAAYAMAPSQESAQALITFSAEQALRNWQEEGEV